MLVINNLSELEHHLKTAQITLTCKNPDHSIHYLGINYLKGMLSQARAMYPSIQINFTCDVDDDSSAAQLAMKAGFKQILFRGNRHILEKLQSIAQHYNATVTQP